MKLLIIRGVDRQPGAINRALASLGNGEVGAVPIVSTHQPAEAVELRLSHLRQLEAESIHILREVASEFDNPVMLYSIGKDSAVMTHLARKAFYPGKIPFPLLHIDTTWKFKEMIAFRDKFTKEQ